MTQRELRNIIVKQLHTYLAGLKVVLSDQTAPEADYPLIYYQSVQQHIPGAANITTAAADGGTLTKYRREHAEATFSFTACSFNRQGKDGPISGDDEALELADRAQGFFLFAGRQLLADLGSRPAWGAWIEIMYVLPRLCVCRPSRPSRGAWIEI